MAKKLFGTDGVRGVANEKVTPELAFALGQRAGAALPEGSNVLIGRDTRRSGPMLGAALAAGFCSAGVNVDSIGIAPTGAISYLARTEGYALGLVISASHNPAPDNGIKFLGPDGRKVADAFELELEASLDSKLELRPTGRAVGMLNQPTGLLDKYMAYLETLVPERLEGMLLLVDGSHGAAYALGPEIFRRLGATVAVTGTEPDGMNINHGCGATHPDTIQQGVLGGPYALAIAFDGDADRAVFCDGKGRLINGDRAMAIWAKHWEPQPPVVVGTVMSNGGFAKYLSAKGIHLERADVGDKYVAAAMERLEAKVGGEQSGHIIFSERGPTGDGLITALEVLRVLKREGKDASELVNEFENWPQLLVNVQVARKEGWESNPAVVLTLAEADARVADRGRVNVRASGTQPMLRVMVEADDADLRDSVSHAIVSSLLNELGGTIYSRVDLTHALGD